MLETCKQQCKECPFKETSLRGWLGELDVSYFRPMMAIDNRFPCHMQLNSSDEEAHDEIKNKIDEGKIKICLGYLESMVKSNKVPRDRELKKLYDKVKREGISSGTMDINEFERHHTISKP